MADVKWIKITTDMFEDEKIDFIQSLPESDAMMVIWVRLLTMAGKCNQNGFIMLTENVPYTYDMLAHKFRKPLPIIKMALQTFTQLNMIEDTENGIWLINWEKHQNIEGLDKIRLQTKERVARFRDKQKLLDTSNVTCNATVTSGNETELELELDKEKEVYKEPVKKTKIKKDVPVKINYAEFVKMTEIEYNKLITEHGEIKTKKMIDTLDNYKGSNNKTYANDYRAILSWVTEKINNSNFKTVSKTGNYKVV